MKRARFSGRSFNYSKPVFNARDPLTGFIVVLLEYVDDEHPCNILNRSAGKSVSLLKESNYRVVQKTYTRFRARVTMILALV